MARVHPTDPSPLLVTKDLCDHVMLPVHDVLPSTDEIKCMLLDNMRLPHVAALPDNRIFPIPRKGNLCELAQDDVRTVPDPTCGLHTERQIDRFGQIFITELRFIQVFALLFLKEGNDKEKKKKKGHGKTEDLRTEPDPKARLGSQVGANTKHQAPSRRPIIH